MLQIAHCCEALHQQQTLRWMGIRRTKGRLEEEKETGESVNERAPASRSASSSCNCKIRLRGIRGVANVGVVGWLAGPQAADTGETKRGEFY